METKICTHCGTLKELSEYYCSNKEQNTFQSHCKKCDNLRKTKYLRQKSKELNKKERQLTLVSKELREKGLKRCPLCKEVKPLESFYTAGNSNGGYASHCIVCSDLLRRTNPKLQENRKESYRRDKDILRDKKLKKQFGISLLEYNQILNSQNNTCAICQEIEKNKSLAVDHCHITRKIRGLLCTKCNLGLGMFQENINLLQIAITYLEKHREIK